MAWWLGVVILVQRIFIPNNFLSFICFLVLYFIITGCVLDYVFYQIILFFFPLFFIIYLVIFSCVGSSFLCIGLSLVAASAGHSSSRCAGLSLLWPLLLRSTGSRRAGSVIVAHGPSFSVACGIFPDQGSNLCPLHWQADSQPLCHQGNPRIFLSPQQILCTHPNPTKSTFCLFLRILFWERNLT